MILSEAPLRIGPMAPVHPWRDLRDRLPDWHVEFVPLPVGIKGYTDFGRLTISVANGLTQRERRSTLLHELQHIAKGHTSECTAEEDAAVELEAARMALPIQDLLRVLPWATTVSEAAEELWVDIDLLWCRLDHLHPSERATIRRAFAARDNEEIL